MKRSMPQKLNFEHWQMVHTPMKNGGLQFFISTYLFQELFCKN